MNKNLIKLIAVAVIALPMLAFMGFNTNVTAVRAVSLDDDATTALYKKNCGACHGPTAVKFYDPEMAMEQQVEAILKGKKAAKPPHMPGFEAKGITAEQATALAEHMKALRTPETN